MKEGEEEKENEEEGKGGKTNIFVAGVSDGARRRLRMRRKNSVKADGWTDGQTDSFSPASCLNCRPRMSCLPVK